LDKRETPQKKPIFKKLKWTIFETLLVLSLFIHLLIIGGMQTSFIMGSPIVKYDVRLIRASPENENPDNRHPGNEKSGGNNANDPSKIESRLDSSFILLKRRKTDQALKAFNEIVKSDPDNVSALSGRGMALAQKKDYDGALIDFNKVIKLSPNDYNAYLNRGDARAKKKQFDKALEDYNHGIKLAPEDPLCYFDRGKVYLRIDKYRLALDDFNTAVEKRMTDAVLLANRGVAYNNLGQPDKAEADYKLALKKDPNMVGVHAALAMLYYKQGKADLALRHLSRAIEMDPTFTRDPFFRESYFTTNPYIERGSIYIEKEMYEEAISDFDMSIKFFPEQEVVYLERGFCYLEMDKQEKAKNDFLKWLKSSGDKSKELDAEEMGVIYYIVGKKDLALTCLNKAIESGDAEGPEPYYYRGLIFYERGDYVSSQRDLERAVKSDDRYSGIKKKAEKLIGVIRSKV